MYCEVTKDVRVEVEPNYVAEQSKPKLNYFFFSYKVRITNIGISSVQLLSRHWVIVDGSGGVHEVQGPGVVGHQPKLQPGETFEYMSFCPLPTPTGNMRGTYQMVDHEDKSFEVKIPLFFLRDLANLH